MNFFEFPGIDVSALAVAVPDNKQINMDLDSIFPDGEVKKFCENTGIWERYTSVGMGITASDLCVAAANKIFDSLDVDRASIDGLIFISQTPDYSATPTSYVIQHRLQLENCGLVYDSNIGCTGFHFGIQMACANIMGGCNRVLVLVGDAEPERGWDRKISKDSLLFGDCGVAAIVERTKKDVPPIQMCLHAIGRDYKKILNPYGGARHSLINLYKERGTEGLEKLFVNGLIIEGADVFTFSITEAPKVAKAFLQHFGNHVERYDYVSIHQANQMIVSHVAKRLKIPQEKVLMSLKRYGNTRGGSVAVNICDLVSQNLILQGERQFFNLSFGTGLSVAALGMQMDMDRCLPVINVKDSFDDGIDNYTYF